MDIVASRVSSPTRKIQNFPFLAKIILPRPGGVNVLNSGMYPGWGGVFFSKMLLCTMVLNSILIS